MELFKANRAATTRWASFENPLGKKGEGALENRGAKGHAFDRVGAGETVTLMDAQGSGVIRRMWMTIDDRSADMLRSLSLRMYWDGAERPAVECPLGDFFGNALAGLTAFDSELFSSPEGKSFNCFIPMPFLTSARVTLTNESPRDLAHLFYEIDYTLEPLEAEDTLYFHAYWNRENPTQLARDYTALPRVSGHGRFLGMALGVRAGADYMRTWFGEGEVKVFLDGDAAQPTIAGTGIEDYIGTGWGQGKYATRTQGCLEVDPEKSAYAFFRWHTIDPIWFSQDIRVTVQQLGGAPAKLALELSRSDVPMRVVSVDSQTLGFRNLYEDDSFVLDENTVVPDGWYNYYRTDDCASTAYFYLDRPESGLPPLAGLDVRTAHQGTGK